MKTKISHVSEIEIQHGIPETVENPLRPERFENIRIAHLTKGLGLSQFGVNQVHLAKGVYTSLRHWHECEDEFVYVLSGTPTLIDQNGDTELVAGSIVSFPAGEENGHHFTNMHEEEAILLVIGSRRPGEDVCHYPDDPLGPIHR